MVSSCFLAPQSVRIGNNSIFCRASIRRNPELGLGGSAIIAPTLATGFARQKPGRERPTQEDCSSAGTWWVLPRPAARHATRWASWSVGKSTQTDCSGFLSRLFTTTNHGRLKFRINSYLCGTAQVTPFSSYRVDPTYDLRLR